MREETEFMLKEPCKRVDQGGLVLREVVTVSLRCSYTTIHRCGSYKCPCTHHLGGLLYAVVSNSCNSSGEL